VIKILGTETMSPQEISHELNRGGKFVRYRYTVSVVFLTITDATDVYFLRAGQNRVIRGLPWIFLTTFAGWWGFPWGPIHSVKTLWVNFRGGEDVTAEVANAMALPSVDWVMAAGAGD
jgi:hypothetical protein